jgi:hypothetical protein
MLNHPLDFQTRETLCARLGEPAGRALADLVLRLATRIEELERSKVSVTPILKGLGRPLRLAAEENS